MVREERASSLVRGLLKNDKTLTEREVKVSVARSLKVRPADLGARVIRDTRKRMGIDRPAAIAFARGLLTRNPFLPAKRVIAEVGERFGIRLSAPDVSRLRPAEAKQNRRARQAVVVARVRPGATVTIAYHAKGHPGDIALFFRTLAQ